MNKLLQMINSLLDLGVKIAGYLPIINKISPQTLRMLFTYIMLGGVAFLADYSLLFFFTEVLGIYYLLSAAMSFCAGVTVNYLLNRKFNFKSKQTNIARQFAIFIGVSLVGLTINEVFLYIFVEYFHIHYMVAKPILLLIISPVSFSLHKFITFREKNA